MTYDHTQNHQRVTGYSQCGGTLYEITNIPGTRGNGKLRMRQIRWDDLPTGVTVRVLAHVPLSAVPYELFEQRRVQL